jgi:lipid-A-disaccharide synthase
MSRSVFIVAAESSGDLHGAELARALHQQDPDLELFGFGGHRMADAGVEVVCDLTEHAAVGISEALRSVWAFRRGLGQATRLLDERRPDAVVLIDSPELNLRLAPRAHDRGIPVVYYICPQVWAWRQGRVKTLARHVDKRLVILPFEPQFYARHGVEATFVGHPLVDTLGDYRHERRFTEELGLPDDGPLIGILPGSRRREISRLLPIHLVAAHRIHRNLEGATLAAAPASTVPEQVYRTWPRSIPERLHLLPGQTYELMAAADLLLIASGTATLEAGIIGTPMIVTYKVSPITGLIARALVRGIEFVSLVNLVAERELVPELLQGRCTPGRIARKAVSFFRDGGLTEMADALAHEVRSRLGEPGAAGRAADEILDLLP